MCCSKTGFCLFSLLQCFTYYLACFNKLPRLSSDAAQNIEKSKMSAKAKQKKHRSTGLTLTYFVIKF